MHRHAIIIDRIQQNDWRRWSCPDFLPISSVAKEMKTRIHLPVAYYLEFPSGA